MSKKDNIEKYIQNNMGFGEESKLVEALLISEKNVKDRILLTQGIDPRIDFRASRLNVALVKFFDAEMAEDQYSFIVMDQSASQIKVCNNVRSYVEGGLSEKEALEGALRTSNGMLTGNPVDIKNAWQLEDGTIVTAYEDANHKLSVGTYTNGIIQKVNTKPIEEEIDR